MSTAPIFRDVGGDDAVDDAFDVVGELEESFFADADVGVGVTNTVTTTQYYHQGEVASVDTNATTADVGGLQHEVANIDANAILSSNYIEPMPPQGQQQRQQFVDHYEQQQPQPEKEEEKEEERQMDNDQQQQPLQQAVNTEVKDDAKTHGSLPTAKDDQQQEHAVGSSWYSADGHCYYLSEDGWKYWWDGAEWKPHQYVGGIDKSVVTSQLDNVVASSCPVVDHDAGGKNDEHTVKTIEEQQDSNGVVGGDNDADAGGAALQHEQLYPQEQQEQHAVYEFYSQNQYYQPSAVQPQEEQEESFVVPPPTEHELAHQHQHQQVDDAWGVPPPSIDHGSQQVPNPENAPAPYSHQDEVAPPSHFPIEEEKKEEEKIETQEQTIAWTSALLVPGEEYSTAHTTTAVGVVGGGEDGGGDQHQLDSYYHYYSVSAPPPSDDDRGDGTHPSDNNVVLPSSQSPSPSKHQHHHSTAQSPSRAISSPSKQMVHSLAPPPPPQQWSGVHQSPPKQATSPPLHSPSKVHQQQHPRYASFSTAATVLPHQRQQQSPPKTYDPRQAHPYSPSSYDASQHQQPHQPQPAEEQPQWRDPGQQHHDQNQQPFGHLHVQDPSTAVHQDHQHAKHTDTSPPVSGVTDATHPPPPLVVPSPFVQQQQLQQQQQHPHPSSSGSQFTPHPQQPNHQSQHMLPAAMSSFLPATPPPSMQFSSSAIPGAAAVAPTATAAPSTTYHHEYHNQCQQPTQYHQQQQQQQHQMRPHTFVKFTFGGRLLRIHSNGTISTHTVQNLPPEFTRPVSTTPQPMSSMTERYEVLSAFPGPLQNIANINKEKGYRSYFEARKEACVSEGGVTSGDASLALWSVLEVLAFSGIGSATSGGGSGGGGKSPPASSSPPLHHQRQHQQQQQHPITEALLPHQGQYHAPPPQHQHQPQQANTMAHASTSLVAIQDLLLSGHKSDAFQVAVESHCWPVAFILGRSLGGQEWQSAVDAYVQSTLSIDAPLRTLCVLASNGTTGSGQAQQQQQVNAVPQWWRHHAAILATNRFPGYERALEQLGTTLLHEGRVGEAHVCFMLAGLPLMPSDGGEFALVGGCRRTSPRTYASIYSILRTEVYLAILLHKGSSATSQQQQQQQQQIQASNLWILPYKLLHAYALADMGLLSPASQYCSSILQTLGTNNSKIPPGLAVCRVAAADLNDRLQQFAAARKITLSSSFSAGSIVSSVGKFLDRGISALMGGERQHSRSNSFGAGAGAVGGGGGAVAPPTQTTATTTPAEATMLMSAAHSRRSSTTTMPTSPSHYHTNINRASSPTRKEPEDQSQSKPLLSNLMSSFRAVVSSSSSTQLHSQQQQQHHDNLPENTFYYDNDLKIWRERGVEPPPPPEEPPPPPTAMAFNVVQQQQTSPLRPGVNRYAMPGGGQFAVSGGAAGGLLPTRPPAMFGVGGGGAGLGGANASLAPGSVFIPEKHTNYGVSGGNGGNGGMVPSNYTPQLQQQQQQPHQYYGSDTSTTSGGVGVAGGYPLQPQQYHGSVGVGGGGEEMTEVEL